MLKYRVSQRPNFICADNVLNYFAVFTSDIMLQAAWHRYDLLRPYQKVCGYEALSGNDLSVFLAVAWRPRYVLLPEFWRRLYLEASPFCFEHDEVSFWTGHGYNRLVPLCGTQNSILLKTLHFRQRSQKDAVSLVVPLSPCKSAESVTPSTKMRLKIKPSPCNRNLSRDKAYPCIQLGGKKFELTNRDSAGGKKSSVLTSSKQVRKGFEIRKLFSLEMALNIHEKGFTCLKAMPVCKKWKIWTILCFQASSLAPKNGSPELGMATRS